MRFKVDGEELSAEGLKIGEICDAEKYLQMDMSAGAGAKIAVALYAAKWRSNPDMNPAAVADWVRRVDMTNIDVDDDDEDDAGPPASNGATS